MNAWGTLAVWAALQTTLFVAASAAVYGLARRRGPAAGSAVATLALLGAIGLWVLAVSPWPRWWTAGEATPKIDAASTTKDRVADTLRVPVEGVDADSTTSAAPLDASTPPRAEVFWRAFLDELRQPSAPTVATAWRWPAWLALALLIGAALACARIALGLTAVRRYRRRTVPLDDGEIGALRDELAAALGCRKPIEVREASGLSSPATVGWRRPLILLPSDWRQWSAGQRRAALAHEIAHVARGDYAAWLAAQMSLALHFYHPLVHWLVGRLRLEQELAADALASSLAGGRTAYLAALAQLALREDDRKASWAARPLLSGRGTLIGRIAMLRDTKFRPAHLSRRGHAALAALLLALGVGVAGLRGPLAPREAQAAPPAKPPQNKEAAAAFDLTYVPDDPFVLVAARPQAILNRPDMAPLRKLLLEEHPLNRDFGTTIPELVEVLWISSDVPIEPNPFDLIVLRREEPFGAIPVLQKLAPVQFQGKTYYKKDETRVQWAYYQPNPSTLVLGSEAQIRRVIAQPDAPPQDAPWRTMWNRVAKDQIAAMMDLARLEQVLTPLQSNAIPPGMAALAPLWEQGNRAVAGLSVSDNDLTFEGYVAADDAQGAEQVRKTLEAGVTLAKNALAASRRVIAQSSNETTKKFALPGLDTLLLALKNARVAADGATVAVHSEVKGKAFASAMALMAPAVKAARIAAKRTQGQNNLKQIALAMHNYHAVHGHLPPAVVMGGKNGKTPHSWRVELLPFLEQNKLYQAYHFDEPWNSPANLKVLKQMPAVYRAPTVAAGATNAAYYVLTGPGTIFDGGKPTEFMDITDGTSNTILVVETKRDIPWTKPEDIAYDPNKPLPKLGGLFEGGFQAAFADGSVRFISEAVDKKVLRKLIEKADGQPVRLR